MNKVKNLRDDWIKDTNNLTKIQFRQFFMTINFEMFEEINYKKW